MRRQPQPRAPRHVHPTRKQMSRTLTMYEMPRRCVEVIDDRLHAIIMTSDAMIRQDGSLNPMFILNLTRAAYMQGFLDANQGGPCRE